MKKAKIYTTKTCPWCVKTKEFFTENKVEYEEIDVSSDQKAAQDMFKLSGQMGVPVTDIDGEIIIGFDKNKLKKALGIAS